MSVYVHGPASNDPDDPLLRAAERVLAQTWGYEVRLGQGTRLTAPSRRNLLLRCPVLSGRGPASLIVKQVTSEAASLHQADPWDVQRFCRDWAGAQFLSAAQDHAPHSPRFYGGDREVGFILLEDLGTHTSLVEPLLHGAEADAVQALLGYAARLGALHTDTIGGRVWLWNGEGRSGRLRSHGPPASPWQWRFLMVPHPWCSPCLMVTLLLLGLLSHVGWPDQPRPRPQPPRAPAKRRRKRAAARQPGPGLSHTPRCEACAQGAEGHAKAPGLPPPLMRGPRGRRPPVDTPAPCWPAPDCSYHGWRGCGPSRAQGPPGGQLGRPGQWGACDGGVQATPGPAGVGRGRGGRRPGQPRRGAGVGGYPADRAGVVSGPRGACHRLCAGLPAHWPRAPRGNGTHAAPGSGRSSPARARPAGGSRG